MQLLQCRNPLQRRTQPTSNLVKWGTPTLIPNTDEPSPTLIMLFVVYHRLNTVPEVLRIAPSPGKIIRFDRSPQWM